MTHIYIFNIEVKESVDKNTRVNSNEKVFDEKPNYQQVYDELSPNWTFLPVYHIVNLADEEFHKHINEILSRNIPTNKNSFLLFKILSAILIKLL